MVNLDREIMSRSLEKKCLNVLAILVGRALLLALASFALLSCHALSHPKGVVGTWEGILSGHRAVCTYKKDGSFLRSIEAGRISWEFDGTYFLKGDTITEEIKAARLGGWPSLSPAIKAMLNKPTALHYKVESDKRLILTDPKGKVIILDRK